MSKVDTLICIENNQSFENSPTFLRVLDDYAVLTSKYSFLRDIFGLGNPVEGELVQIEFVHVVADRTIDTRDSDVRRAGRVMIGASLGGLVGALLLDRDSGVLIWDVDVDVYLADGRVVETTLRFEGEVRALHPYMERHRRRFEHQARVLQQKKEQLYQKEQRQAERARRKSQKTEKNKNT